VRTSLKQLGRGATLFAATSLLMATTAVIPAEAANKAGAACTKANAKTKIGGDNYVCTKNPTVKNAKLTWVWIGCIQAQNEYLTSVQAVKDAKEKLDSAIVMIDMDIATLNSKKPEYESRAIALEKDAAAWKQKANDASSKAKVIRDSLNSKNFAQVVDKTHLDLLRTVLKPPVDTTISPADVTLLTTRWSTTADKLELWYDAIQEFALKEQAANYIKGESNALKSAESIRKELTKQVTAKELEKSKAQNNFTILSSDVKSQLSTRKMACRAGL